MNALDDLRAFCDTHTEADMNDPLLRQRLAVLIEAYVNEQPPRVTIRLRQAIVLVRGWFEFWVWGWIRAVWKWLRSA